MSEPSSAALGPPPATAPDCRPGQDRPVRTVTRLATQLDAIEVLGPQDLDAAFEVAVRLEEEARAASAVDLQLRARLVQAAVRGRRGETAECGRILHDVNRWAAEHDHRYLLARSHRHLA